MIFWIVFFITFLFSGFIEEIKTFRKKENTRHFTWIIYAAGSLIFILSRWEFVYRPSMIGLIVLSVISMLSQKYGHRTRTTELIDSSISLLLLSSLTFHFLSWIVK